MKSNHMTIEMLVLAAAVCWHFGEIEDQMEHNERHGWDLNP